MDDGALEELAVAVAGAPDNHELRLVYGTRLLQVGRAGEALTAAQHVLAADPASVAALRIAADAARTDGRADLAVSYRRLLAALGAADATPPPADAAPAPAPHGNGDETPASPRAPRDASDPLADPPTEPDTAASPSDDGGPGDADVTSDVDRPEVTLYDVAGLEDVKRRLRTAFLGPLRNPELQKAFGATLRGGLLLYGPPGCGKTFIAKALAGELGARFIALGITDIVDPYIGVSERNLHNHFELARRSAPCVLFLDEIDALGRKRSQLAHSAGRGIVNQLLAELDSVNTDNSGLFVLAATNHPWDVDVALRRPGRFDRTVLVPPPDRVARQAIFAYHLRDRPVEVTGFDDVAGLTDGYSGADIAHVCGTAVEAALERSIAQGGVSPVTKVDLLTALREIRPSIHAWFETARNYVLYANEHGQYDELSRYLRSAKLL